MFKMSASKILLLTLSLSIIYSQVALVNCNFLTLLLATPQPGTVDVDADGDTIMVDATPDATVGGFDLNSSPGD